MGLCYYIVCHDCKVGRDLDKFHSLEEVASRNEAIEQSKDIDSFRHVLLGSFMKEHQGCKCEFMSEDPFYELKEDFEYKEDKDFWH